MDRMDDLIARIRTRVADPLRAVDAAAWVRPLPQVAPPATAAELDAAEEALGFPIPPLLRRLYAEVGNDGWGPDYGLGGVPTAGSVPDGNDLVGLYQLCTAPERDLEDPEAQWPRGLVPLIALGCVSMECVDFLHPPYPVFKLDGDRWTRDQAVVDALIPVEPSLAERLEVWLTTESV